MSISKPAKPAPKRPAPTRDGVMAKAEPAVAIQAAVVESRGGDAGPSSSVSVSVSAFPAKQRCHGATRYGQPCRLWAGAGGDFCYWCERAGRPRYPLAAPAGEAASAAVTSTRKQRCRGTTVFGQPCGCSAVGEDGLCLWCQAAEKRGKDAPAGQ